MPKRNEVNQSFGTCFCHCLIVPEWCRIPVPFPYGYEVHTVHSLTGIFYLAALALIVPFIATRQICRANAGLTGLTGTAAFICWIEGLNWIGGWNGIGVPAFVKISGSSIRSILDVGGNTSCRCSGGLTIQADFLSRQGRGW